MVLNDVNIDNILVSNKISSGKKNYNYCIGCLGKNKIKPFSIILPKTNTCVKSYDGETKWIYFLSEDEESSKKYNDIMTSAIV